MKKAMTLLAAAGLLLASCAEISDIGSTIFEGNIEVPNAVVTHASGVKTRTSIAKTGIGNYGKTVSTIDKYSGAGERYQTIHVSGGGYNMKGDVDYTGYMITTGTKGVLKVGKKTGSFKGFEPSY